MSEVTSYSIHKLPKGGFVVREFLPFANNFEHTLVYAASDIDDALRFIRQELK